MATVVQAAESTVDLYHESNRSGYLSANIPAPSLFKKQTDMMYYNTFFKNLIVLVKKRI